MKCAIDTHVAISGPITMPAVRLGGIPLEGDRQRCEVWSRVMGYHRPIDQWNIGKKQEHTDRTHFVEPRA